jgi:hypothetical protein
MIDLMLSLVAMFVTTGKVALPPGRREDVIALLTDLMAARDRFRAYVELLTAELERQGVRLRLLQAPDLAIPDEQIAREGFGSVPDENLADIALSPEALEAIQEYLDDEETEEGDWLTEAIIAVESARPDVAERSAAARGAFQRFLEMNDSAAS